MSSAAAEEEEEQICRVCHCEGDEESPLFHPCTCKGTIRFIHQECLVQWLHHKGGEEKRCELCGSEFQFRSVYRTGEVSAWALASALFSRVTKYVCSVSFVCCKFLLWLVVTPIFSSCWLDVMYAVAAERHSLHLMLTQLRFDINAVLSFKLVACWWSGCLTTVIALLFGFGALQIIAALLTALTRQRIHAEPGGGGGGGGGGADNGVQLGLQRWIQRMIPFERQQIPFDAADEDGREELNNIGDVAIHVQHWGFVISCVASILFGASVVPVLLGRFFLNILGLPQWLERGCRAYLLEVASLQQTEWFDAKLLLALFSSGHSLLVTNQAKIPVDEMTATSVADNLWPHILLTLEAVAGAFLILGTICLCALCALIRHYFDERYKRENTDNVAAALGLETLETEATGPVADENDIAGVERAATLVCGWVKTCIALIFDGIVLPQATGWLLGLLTLRAVGVSLEERMNTCFEIPILCAVAHWGFGLLFMLHIAHVLLELRELLHPEVLANILPERHLDREERAVDFFAHRSFTHLFQKMATSLILIILAVFASVLLPVHVGHWAFFGIISPLRLRFEDVAMEAQLPVEVIIFHLFVPLLLERLRHREFIREILSAILSNACKWLDLADILDPRTANTEEERAEFGILQRDEGIHLNPNMQWGAGEVEHVGHEVHEANEGIGQPAPVLNVSEQADISSTHSLETADLSSLETNDPLHEALLLGNELEPEECYYTDSDTDTDCSELEMDHIFAYIKANSPPRTRRSLAGESLSGASSSVYQAGPGALEKRNGYLDHQEFSDDQIEHREDVRNISRMDNNRDFDSNMEIGSVVNASEANSNAREDEEGVAVPYSLVSSTTELQEMSLNAIPTYCEAPEQFIYASISRPLRVAILCCILTAAMALTTVLIVHVPLELGRLFFRWLRFPIGHDLYNYATGLTISYGMFRLTYFLRDYISQRDLRVENMHRVLAVLGHSVGVFLKWVALAVIWLGLPPLLIGCLLEAVIVVPLRTPLNETPVYPIAQCWALGLIFLKIWARTVLVGAMGENRFRAPMELMVHHGIDGLDATHALREIVCPVLGFLLDLYCTPYFCARILCMFCPESYFFQTFLTRYCYLSYICIKLVGNAYSAVRSHVSKLHDEIRDDLYLERQQLTNR